MVILNCRSKLRKNGESPTSEHHKQYIGNRLVSYGLRIRMTTTWHRGRGDTAGYFTKV